MKLICVSLAVLSSLFSFSLVLFGPWKASNKHGWGEKIKLYLGLIDVWLFVINVGRRKKLFVVEFDTRVVPRLICHLKWVGDSDFWPWLGRHQRWVIYKHNLYTRNSVWYLPQTAAIQVISNWQRSILLLPDMLFTLAGFTRYLLTWVGSGQFGCSAGSFWKKMFHSTPWPPWSTVSSNWHQGLLLSSSWALAFLLLSWLLVSKKI